MKLLRRIALVVLIVLLVGGVGLYLASRCYLSSSNVTGQVSTRLQAMLGAPVQVESADVGLTGDSSLHGLRIFEPGDAEKKTPIITVDSATADASALDLMRGKDAERDHADRRLHRPPFRRRRQIAHPHAQAADRRRLDAARPHRQRQAHAQPGRPAGDGHSGNQGRPHQRRRRPQGGGCRRRPVLGRLVARRLVQERVGRRRPHAGREGSRGGRGPAQGAAVRGRRRCGAR